MNSAEGERGRKTDMIDLAITGGTIVTADQVAQADIGILGEEISVIAAPGLLPSSRRVLDASGCYVLPGIVDPHTHPGNTGLLGYEIVTESRSAAVGGVTTMLGTVKSTRMSDEAGAAAMAEDPGSYLDVFPTARRQIDASAHVDVGLSFIVMTRQQAQEIPDCVRECGVTSFKFHMTFPPKTAWGAHIGIPVFPDDGTVFSGFQACADTGALAMIHAENHQVVDAIGDRLAAGRHGLQAAAARFPGYLEASEIRKAAEFARITGARAYAVHVSSREGLTEVIRARGAGTTMAAETCPQYLVLDTDSAEDDSGLLKFNPPIRRRADLDALWEGIQNRQLDAVGSDHVPHMRDAKLPAHPGASTLPGSPGIATLLPLVWTYGVRAGRVSLQRLVEVMSTTPAQLFGLFPKKGVIAVGADADLVIVDPERRAVVEPSTLGSLSDFSAYEGMELIGWPRTTILRGETVVDGGQLVGRPRGRYLHRSVP